LKESMWCMVSEQTSKLDGIDFAGYTAENIGRFERAYEVYKQS